MKRTWFPAPTTLLKNCRPLRLTAILPLLGLLVTLAAGSVAQASLLGTAGQYGEFVLGDSTRWGADSHGKIAVGGNLTFPGSGFTVASQQSNATTNLVVGGTFNANGASVKGSIVTGGNATYTNPTVFGNFSSNGSLTLGSGGTVNGNVRHATTYNQNGTTVSGTNTTGTTPLPVDFASEATYLKALSLAQVNPSDPTPTFQWSQMFITAGAGAHYFNLTSANILASPGGFVITAPAGSSVVLNVSGSGFTFPNTGLTLSGGISLSDILWNFYDATSFTMSSANGTFLAPLAAVTANSGGFNGNLIVGSLYGNVETHTTYNGTPTFYDGELRSPPPVPEPAALGMLLVGAISGASFFRRRTA